MGYDPSWLPMKVGYKIDARLEFEKWLGSLERPLRGSLVLAPIESVSEEILHYLNML